MTSEDEDFSPMLIAQALLSSLADVVLPPEIQLELGIDPTILDQEMLGQVQRFARWAILSAEAHSATAKAKFDLEVITANVDEQVRNQAADEGRKITEDGIKAAIRRDVRYQNAYDTLLDAEAEAAVLAKLELAFKMRSDMLINLGATYRRELATR